MAELAFEELVPFAHSVASNRRLAVARRDRAPIFDCSSVSQESQNQSRVST